MKSQKTKICTLTIILTTMLVAAACICRVEAQEGKVLTEISLDEYIQTVTKNDTVFEQILIDQLVLKYQKDLGLPARDLVLAVKQQYLLDLENGGDGIETEVSLSKLFPLQRTKVSVAYSVEGLGGLDPRESELNFTIAQPIAENAFGRGTKLLDKIIGLEVEVARHQIIEAYEDYFATVITAYVIWHEAWENVQIAESSYSENRKLLKDIRAREQKQIALPIDVNKIRLQVLAKEETLIEFRERYQTAYNVVQRSIRGSRTGYQPTSVNRYNTALGGFESEFRRFRESGRTFEILDRLEKKTSFQVQKDADDLLPSVELSAGYRLQGDQYSFKNKDHILFAGITVSFPFSDQVQEAEHAVSRIRADKQKLVTTNTDFDLRADLKNLYVQIARERELLEISKKKIDLAQSVLKDEAENYSFGKVVLNDYIQAVNVLDSNRFSKVARKARMHRQMIEWLRLSDQLISKKDIE